MALTTLLQMQTTTLTSPHLLRTHVLLLSILLFYTLIWNYVFSNLPLHVPMANAVHSRFWLQPNMIAAIYSAVGVEFIKARTTSKFKKPLQCALLLLLTAYPLYTRLSLMDRSDALFSSTYGVTLLSSLPPNAILLSHTDLDWNTVRYLRECEHMRRDVTHLSAQLLPYPWFGRQNGKQGKPSLYGDVQFPAIKAGVSTNKYHEGNTILLQVSYTNCVNEGERRSEQGSTIGIIESPARRFDLHSPLVSL